MGEELGVAGSRTSPLVSVAVSYRGCTKVPQIGWLVGNASVLITVLEARDRRSRQTESRSAFGSQIIPLECVLRRWKGGLRSLQPSQGHGSHS